MSLYLHIIHSSAAPSVMHTILSSPIMHLLKIRSRSLALQFLLMWCMPSNKMTMVVVEEEVEEVAVETKMWQLWAPWLVHFFHWRMFQDVGLAQVDYMTSVWLGSYRVVQCTCILVTVSLSVKLIRAYSCLTSLVLQDSCTDRSMWYDK